MAAFAGEISIFRGKGSSAGGTIVSLRCSKRRTRQMAKRYAAATVTGIGACPQRRDRARKRSSGKAAAGWTSRRGDTRHAGAYLQGSGFSNWIEGGTQKIFTPSRRNLLTGLRKHRWLLVRNQRRNNESPHWKDETRY